MILNPESSDALERQAREELRELTEQQALLATEALLAMAEKAHVSQEKERSLGLIERQRILYGLK